ncbi:MAG TPA: DedA family protein [candidate division Zixibacteria bacterium]|nr:DedA family protein [candidate division Zixibacteria bacterium]
MVSQILLVLAEFIKNVISSLGLPGIAVLMAIESACIPLPSEVIMPFAGYLVYSGRFASLWVVALLGAIGCNLGSVLAYEIGAFGGRPLIERYGRYILMNRHDLEVSDRFFQKYGSITVFIGRLLPVIRTFIALPAGIARMPRLRFHIYTFVGSFPWCYALAYVGLKLGERWETDPRLKQWLHRFDALIVLVLLAGIVWFVRNHLKNRVRGEQAVGEMAD